MKIVLCDDQEIYRKDILESCKRILEKKDIVYKEFASGEELLYSEEAFDFLFLDIEMTGLDGIQVKELLEKRGMKGKIIFLTSHEERMIEAFGANVIGFLRKPVQEEALVSIVQKMKLFMDDRITIEWEVDGSMYVAYAEEIQYIEAQDKYTCVAVGTKQYLVRRSLREWEVLLQNSDFCKVNRSFLVNVSLLDRVKSEIVLDDGKTITISRKYKKEIEEQYKRYLRKQMERM